jgi:hypothetical protein
MRAVLAALLFGLSFSTLSSAPTSVNMSHDLVTLGIASQNLVPNTPALDAQPLFTAALQYVEAHHIQMLTLDTGAYYFLNPTPGQYLNIAYTSDLTIDLAGSTMYYDNPFYSGFAIFYCQRITLENFVIDFINTPFTQVQLTGVNGAARQLFYQPLPGWPDPAQTNAIADAFGGLELWSLAFRNGAVVPGTSRMPVQDGVGGGIIQLAADPAPWTQAATLNTLQPGDTVVFMARNGATPVYIFGSDSMTLSNVTVHGAGSWAVDFDWDSNSVADHVSVMPRPGALIGSTADGIHFTMPGPNNHIRNSYVTGTVDDAFAIDSHAVGTVMSETGPNTLHIRRSFEYRFPNGTPINFVDVTTTAEIGGATIVSQSPSDTDFPLANGEIDLTFDRALPALQPGMELVYADPNRRGSGSTIEDNVSEGFIIGRGVWVSGSEGVTVQRNRISGTSNGGIVVSQDTKAFPGPPGHDIVVQSNIVTSTLGPMAVGTGTENAVAAIMVVSTNNPNFEFSRTATNTNVSILSNFIADSGRAGIWIDALNGGLVQNNVIVRWFQHPELPIFGIDSTDRPIVLADISQPLTVRFSGNVTLADNTIDATSTLAAALTVQPTSVQVASAGGSGAFGVQANVTGFGWTATSDASWLTVTAGQTGAGAGTVSYTVDANPAATPRTGHITVAGQTFTLTEAGQPPVLTAQPRGQIITPGRAVTLTTAATPGPATFQWFLGASGNTAAPVAGAVSSAFHTPALSDTTSYWVRATNAAGSADSATVTITLRALRLPDLDGNGRADLLWRHPLTGEDGLWTMNGAQIAGALALPTAGPPWEIAGTGDLNGDGSSDLIWRNPATGENGVWLMNGGSIITAAAIPGAPPPWEIAAVADFNGDGRADIFWRNPQTGENGLWLMNGAQIAGSGALPGAGLPWQIVGAGDFNGDGRADLWWRNPVTGDNGLWLLDGFAILGAQALPSAGLPWQVVGVADFNHDGRVDILWRQPQTGDNGLWLMNGFQIQAAQALPSGAPPWQIVGVGDLNGDGRADIFWRQPLTGENAVWLMNGFAIQDGRALPAAGVGWEIR